MTTATHLLVTSARWTPAEIREVSKHRGKVGRGKPPPDWTGTTLTLWLVFHLLMALAIWAVGG